MRNRVRIVAMTVAVPMAIVAGPVGSAAAASAKHFSVQGVVLSHHGKKVRVLASSTKVGTKTTVAPHVVTLSLSSGARKHLHSAPNGTLPAPTNPTLQAGQEIVATGSLSGGHYTVSGATIAVLPAQAMIGTILAVGADGQTLTVARHDHVDGSDSSDDNNDLILVQINGAPVSGPAPAVGQYVVVLGESDNHAMLAASMYTFAATAPPSLVAGRVVAADATAKTLSIAARGHEDGGHNEDNQGNQNDAVPMDHGGDSTAPVVSVDASNATVVVNGVGGLPGAVTYPAVGDKVLAVGTAGAAVTPGNPTSLVAALVFDFNGQDDGSVGENEHSGHDGHGD